MPVSALLHALARSIHGALDRRREIERLRVEVHTVRAERDQWSHLYRKSQARQEDLLMQLVNTMRELERVKKGG